MDRKFYIHSSGNIVAFSILKTGGSILSSCGGSIPTIYSIDYSDSGTKIKYTGSGSQLTFKEYDNRLYVIPKTYTTTEIISLGMNAEASAETIMKRTWDMPAEIKDNWTDVIPEQDDGLIELRDDLKDIDKRVTKLENEPAVDPSLELRVKKLEAAAEGNLYMFREDSSEAYSKAVPADVMKWATLDKIGGKSVVKNQHVTVNRANGATLNPDGSYTVDMLYTNSSNALRFAYNGITADHLYYINMHFKELDGPLSVGTAGIRFTNVLESGVNYFSTAAVRYGGLIRPTANGDIVSYLYKASTYELSGRFTFYPQVIDLTQWFGAELADTITTTEQAYALGLPREPMAYDPGTIVSADVESVDITSASGIVTASKAIPSAIRSLPGYGETGAVVDFEIKNYTAPDGTQTDISDLIPDGFTNIEFEVGGSITFKQSGDLQLPVPNQETWMIKLGGATA